MELDATLFVALFVLFVTSTLLILFSIYICCVVEEPSLTFVPNEINNHLIDSVPSLTAPFFPSILLWNGHMSTIVASAMRSKPTFEFRREELPLSDGASVWLDWFHEHLQSQKRAVVVVLHGLTGGSHEK
jgi:hypothetical protein